MDQHLRGRLEKAFGDAPAETARAIARAAIEDATGRPDAPVFDLNRSST